MQNSQPLISIVMNCYNSDTYLREALDSVISQTYKNWEIIFWDNQSTDKSSDIIKSYSDDRIKYFYASEHTDLGKARNLAIDVCSGEWIGFLDCDDIWNNNKLNIYIQKLVNSVNVSLIYSNTTFIDANNNILFDTKKSISGFIYNELLFDGNFIVFSSILVNKNILFQVGKIDDSLNYCEDYDLLLKITKEYNAVSINKSLTFYRQHIDSITNLKLLNNTIETINFLNRYLLANNLSFYQKFRLKCNISYFLLISLVNIIKSNSISDLLTLLRNYPFEIILIPISLSINIIKRFL